jgi:hypothetical protein
LPKDSEEDVGRIVKKDTEEVQGEGEGRKCRIGASSILLLLLCASSSTVRSEE